MHVLTLIFLYYFLAGDLHIPDGSIDFVRENFPYVKVVVNDRNSGLSITNNKGASFAIGDYLFFFNNDTDAFPDLIRKLVSAIEEDERYGLVYAVQLPYDSSLDEDWYKKRSVGFSACGADIYGYPCPALSIDKIFYPDAAIFIKKEVFFEIGSFDPDFFLYGEDVDISWRVHLLGYKIAYVDEPLFRHDSNCMQT